MDSECVLPSINAATLTQTRWRCLGKEEIRSYGTLSQLRVNILGGLVLW
jgi:hypothetical protein